MSSTVLYCTVLYCTVLYCTVLYCTVLYCTVLYCTVLYCVQEMSATGMNHTEGGWPREVRTDNAEHRIKYIRSACGYFLI